MKKLPLKLKKYTMLNKSQKEIIRDRYYLGKTQFEIANEFNISQAQVSRLEKTALKHMRKYV